MGINDLSLASRGILMVSPWLPAAKTAQFEFWDTGSGVVTR